MTTWADAVIRVMSDAGEPLHYKEITRRILSANLKTGGASPETTVNATIADSIKRDPASPFVRVSQAVYTLRSAREDASGKVGSTRSPLAAFGMHWARDQVQWTTKPRLYGRITARADRVNLTDQRGLYLLHDAREVIYAGQAFGQGIGSRLSQHTTDRLAGRWRWFSWFGTCPVGDDGRLGEPLGTASPEQFIDAMESLLIEALEPRQNRAAPITASEYLQARDPRF